MIRPFRYEPLPQGHSYVAESPDADAGATGGGAERQTGKPGAGAGAGDGKPDQDAAGKAGGAQGANGEATLSKEEAAKLSKQLGELQAQNKALEKRLAATESESIGRKKLLQAYEGLTPEEAKLLKDEKSKREQEDRESRGLYEEQLEHERKATAKEREARVKAEDTFHSTMIERDILAGAAAQGALKQASKPLIPGGKSPIVRATEDLFEFDTDLRQTFHRTEKNEDGTRMTPEQFFARERTGTLSIYFGSAVKTGAGGDGAEGDAANRPIKISRSDPNKLAKYEEAKKSGRPIEMVE